MAKDKYTRENFRSSLLKQIIIRADFSSLTDLKGGIMKLKSEKWFQDIFIGYRPIKTNNINMQISSKAIEDRFIPVEVNETGTIHRFFDCKIEPLQDTFIDIGPTFVCATIQCNEKYDKIDPYIDFMINVINALQDYDTYIQLERLAIRKIDGSDYSNIDEAYKIFEKKADFEENIIEDITLLKKSYTDAFISKKAKIKVNLTRSLERFQDEKIRYVLDMDGYVDLSLFAEKKIEGSQLQDIFKARINEELFEIFKASVTDEFLSKGLIK